jgi:hypothetical protein
MIKKSSTINVAIAFTDSEGAALPITGATIRFMIKLSDSKEDAEAIISKATGSGVTITDGPGGLATAVISATDAQALPKNETVYAEAMAVYGDGTIVRTETQKFVFANNIIKAIV